MKNKDQDSYGSLHTDADAGQFYYSPWNNNHSLLKSLDQTLKWQIQAVVISKWSKMSLLIFLLANLTSYWLSTMSLLSAIQSVITSFTLLSLLINTQVPTLQGGISGFSKDLSRIESVKGYSRVWISWLIPLHLGHLTTKSKEGFPTLLSRVPSKNILRNLTQ